MLTISTKSWHYRLLNFVDHGDVPDNLCAYVRSLVIAFLLIGMVGIAGFGLLIMLYVAFAFWTDTLFGLFGAHDPVRFAGMIGAGTTIFILGIVIYVGFKVRVALQERNRDSAEPSSPGLAVMWYRGVRDKICFRLSFK